MSRIAGLPWLTEQPLIRGLFTFGVLKVVKTPEQEVKNNSRCGCSHTLDLSKGSFNTYIQPIFSLIDLSTFGYEILNRPVEFPTESYYDEIFECGCYRMIDQFLLDHSLRTAKSFPGPIFINVYPSSLLNLNSKDTQYKNIVFELNERQFSYDCGISTICRKGFTLALDDVGKGGAGLRALIEIEPHFLKIDRWLVSGIQSSKKKQELVRFLVSFSMGRSKLIAEGIENQEELDVIKNLGVQLGQGYLLSKPELI
jgi:EAL domain-containing protein (putative c-di-GMP-specific phosphodiesterase class I)